MLMLINHHYTRVILALKFTFMSIIRPVHVLTSILRNVNLHLLYFSFTFLAIFEGLLEEKREQIVWKSFEKASDIM